MLAPPGAGKGTQARLLAERFHIEHIASGELLRAEVDADSELGREAEAYLARGDLVPDHLVTAMVHGRCIVAARAGGFVLDGFPRNLAQAQAAHAAALDNELMLLDAVVFLEVSDEELHRRLLGRARSEQRTDDDAAVVEHRLAVYTEQTEPLLDFYAGRGILHRIDGEHSVQVVFNEIVEALSAFAH